MTRSYKVMGFILVTLFGAWGCSKGPVGNANSEKNPTLSAKLQRMEEDFRAAAAARDQFRAKFLAVEAKLADTERQTAEARVQAEESRNTLANTSAELRTRTHERDAIAAQYDSFRRNLKNLIGQAEITLAQPTSPASPPTAVWALPMPSLSSALSN